jgi:hypothetical protein
MNATLPKTHTHIYIYIYIHTKTHTTYWTSRLLIFSRDKASRRCGHAFALPLSMKQATSRSTGEEEREEACWCSMYANTVFSAPRKWQSMGVTPGTILGVCMEALLIMLRCTACMGLNKCLPERTSIKIQKFVHKKTF